LKELVSEIRRNHSQLKFQAVEIEHLNERQTVQDALSLVCALHHRADRTHWLNMLRAPWCGLTLADLHTLAADNHRETIWQLMQDEARLSKLTQDGQLRLAHIKSVLTVAFDGQGRMPLRRWIESTWLQLGGGKCLVEAGDNRDVQVFFDLVEKTGRSGHLDIAALELGMEKLYAKPDIDADGSVQFLTIHKSKGLEFDTVILPSLNRTPRHADNELLMWQEVMVDNHLHLIAAPLKSKAVSQESSSASVYDFLKDLEKQRAENEVVRLLYVAATRAHRQLHLIASLLPNHGGDIKPATSSLLHALWPAVGTDFNQAPVFKINEIAARSLDINQFKPKLQRLFSAEFATGIYSINSQKTTSENNQFKQPEDSVSTVFSFDESELNANLYKNCGTLAHLYMELFAKSDLQGWANNRLQECLPAMQKWLMQQGHAFKYAEKGAIQVMAALNATLTSEAGLWVLQNHAEAASELSLMQPEGEGVKNHVIDRTFIINGTRWVVDYKLTHLDENFNDAGDLNVAAEQHRPQLERYASLFSNQGHIVKKAVLFLNFGKLIEL
jgi:ATP-dependent exoDNAse (exonuclease V) beta subunit